MSNGPDVIVVGAGLSGLMAALMAARQGARVMVVARGVGNIYTGSGCVGVLGYTSLGTAVSSPSRLLTRSLKDFPDHPYVLAGREALDLGMAALQEICGDAGYSMEGSLKENYWLPSPIGGLIAVALAPASMVAGHQTDDEESWALVDFEGWRDFDAAYAAANLGPQVRAVSIGLPEDALRPNMSALEVARLFDQPGLRAQVAAKLANQVGDSSRVGFPAVLGWRYAADALADLSERLGRTVFEVVSMPPSVPGVRLYNVLREALHAMGVEVVLGPTVKGWMGDRQLQGVRTYGPGGERRIKAGAVVLATGGLVGGGLEASMDGLISETVFDLAVDAPERKVWFDELFMGRHAIFEAGLKVNSWMQPLDAGSNVYSTRLYAVGGLLAAGDRMGMHATEGIDLATAARAAQVLTS